MGQYITFHQVSLDKENLALQHLFGLNTPIKLGIQQFSGTFLRNPKNSNQIQIPDDININPSEYNRFSNCDEAFDIIRSFIYSEYKMTDDKLDTLLEKNKKDLYFYVFEEDDEEEKPKFRGVLHSSYAHAKLIFYVAFSKQVEFEYDRDLYKK